MSNRITDPEIRLDPTQLDRLSRAVRSELHRLSTIAKQATAALEDKPGGNCVLNPHSPHPVPIGSDVAMSYEPQKGTTFVIECHGGEVRVQLNGVRHRLAVVPSVSSAVRIVAQPHTPHQ